VAAQKEAEEDYRRLNAQVQAVIDTQELIRKRQDHIQQRLDSLESELRHLKEEFRRTAMNFASREDLRDYASKLKDMEEKRLQDKELILKNLQELARAATTEPRPGPRRSPERTEEDAYVYTVKKNDTLLDIVAAYNAEFEKQGLGKVTTEQVLKANPRLKRADLLLLGQKIKIPIPPKETKD
jgi:hypothetical protein